MKKLKNVFEFTFLNQVRSKGFKTLTIIFAAILLVLPMTIMPLVELLTKDSSGESDDLMSAENMAKRAAVTDVFYFTDGVSEEFDFSILGTVKMTGYEHAEFKMAENYEKAMELAASKPKSLVLGIFSTENAFKLKATLPKSSDEALDSSDARLLAFTAVNDFPALRVMAMGITEEQAQALSQRVYPTEAVEEEPSEGTELTEEEMVRNSVLEVLSFVLLYVNIMLIYFLVLFYGTSVANSVVMEKSSKLMDTMLVSVTPGTMIWGKLLASFTAAVTQFLIWVISAVLGFAIGTKLVFVVNPDSTMGFANVLAATGDLPPLFGVFQIIIAVLMVLAGFLMYCAIASVCGSLASKEEELSSTMSLFTMILIISFFAVFYTSGFLGGEVAAGLKWYDIVPFTSIMVTPARLLLDKITPLQGALSMLVVFVVTAAAVWLAGRVYKLMSMYKGNPPKLGQVIKMLKNSK